VKKFSKLVCLLMCALMLMAVGCGGEEKKAETTKDESQGKWIVAINATFPPFEAVKEGTKDYVGIDIDIANYLGQKMNKKVEFQDMKFASLVPTLQSKRADIVISGISPTAEREKVVDFTKPYYFPMKALICKKGSGFDSLEKLKGHKAGASMGTTYVNELKQAGGIEVAELDNTPLVVQDIKNGRLQAGLFDSAQAAVFVKQNPELEMHTLNLPIVKDDTFAIAMQKGSKDLAQVDKLLQEMQNNGEMNKILAKHLGDEAAKQYADVIGKLDKSKIK